MNLDDFKTDLNKAEDGVWVDFGDGAEILIAQWGNKAHSRFLKTVYKQNKRQIDLDVMGDEAAARLMAGQWPHIIRDWKGINKGGEELAYSPQTVVDLSLNPQYKNFFSTIGEIAKDQATYRSQAVEELGKN